FGLCLPDPEPGHGRPVDAPWGKETQRTDLCAPQTLCPHWGPLQPLYGTALAKLWAWGPQIAEDLHDGHGGLSLPDPLDRSGVQQGAQGFYSGHGPTVFHNRGTASPWILPDPYGRGGTGCPGHWPGDRWGGKCHFLYRIGRHILHQCLQFGRGLFGLGGL